MSQHGESQSSAGGCASSGELTSAHVATLQALWDLRNSPSTSARDVQERAAANGHRRSVAAIRRALDLLVGLGYAERWSWSFAHRPERRVRYWATRRPGETIPDTCIGSDFRIWLWESRMEWRLWALHIGQRMVCINGCGIRASANDWAWLATRPALILDGEPTPDDPAWRET